MTECIHPDKVGPDVEEEVGVIAGASDEDFGEVGVGDDARDEAGVGACDAVLSGAFADGGWPREEGKGGGG